jgi:predicted acetyltransferase
MELVKPSEKFYKSYIEAIEEYQQNNIDTYDFLEVTKYDIFEKIENMHTGKNLPEGYVKATYFWLVDGDEFVGEISVRHSLTDSLLRFGGNIGYGIRYSHWNKGIGTIMLSKSLVYARDVLGLSKVLITCNDNNNGSARVIEKNGGILQDKIINNIDGTDRLSRRYWIEL